MTRPSVWLAAMAIALAGCGGKPPTTQDERDRRFQQMMNGVSLVGRSTSIHHDRVSGEERYVIEKVTKLTGETWLFQSRFQYGTHNLAFPVPVSIQWAGDTPVITLTDLSIPGLGTYTARVVLYDGQYAGTWSGKNVGGQIFGKIVKNPSL